jgi:hypothetical protein
VHEGRGSYLRQHHPDFERRVRALAADRVRRAPSRR